MIAFMMSTSRNWIKI